MRYKRILVTTDFSDESLAALELATGLEADETVLFTVVADWTRSKFYARQNIRSDFYKKAVEQMQQEALSRLDQLSADYFSKIQTRREAVVSVHSAAHEIANYAAKYKCDLIVIASQGRGAVERALLGSTVQKLLHLAACPVLVAPAKWRPAGGKITTIGETLSV